MSMERIKQLPGVWAPLGDNFVTAVAEAFASRGKPALDALAQRSPLHFLLLAAALLPREENGYGPQTMSTLDRNFARLLRKAGKQRKKRGSQMLLERLWLRP